MYEIVEPSDDDRGLTVTFMGATTPVISDGETVLITDGYFTRPTIYMSSEFGAYVEPDRSLIKSYHADLSIEEAAAVVVVHSHFDRRNHGLLPKGEPVLLELETAE